MYEQGVDVIFVPAGGSGIGVIDAATALSTETRPLWVIGVDSDQYYDISDTQRTHLLTSMFKGFDVGIHAVVAAVRQRHARRPKRRGSRPRGRSRRLHDDR